MQNKTQTYLIYLLIAVALVLLYKVFNWDQYRCKACGKMGASRYLCSGCGASGKEYFRQRPGFIDNSGQGRYIPLGDE